MSERLQVQVSEGVCRRLHIAATLRKVRPGALAEELLNKHLPTADEIASQLAGQTEATDAAA